MTESPTPALGDDPTAWTAIEALAALRGGLVSAERLVAAVITRTEALAHLHTLIALDADGALATARRIDARRAAGETLGPLAGLPIVAKDNIDSATLPTTAGSTAFADWQPTADAPVLAALLAADAILLGKANMHEMAFGTTSNNPVYGPVRNPYNTAMIAGGSSGGTAAAIAARIVTAGLGTDTGGSCRVPAALCGCAGFRPSFGRYSSAGVIPLTWTLDTPGPLARNVDDLILLDRVCAKYHHPPTTTTTLAGLRLAVPPSLFNDLDPELERVVEATLAKLREADTILVDADVATLRRNTVDEREGPVAVATYLLEHDSRRSVFDVFSAVTGTAERERLLAQLRHGPSDSSAFVKALMHDRPAYLDTVANYFKAHQIRAAIMPTTILPARLIGQDDTVELNGRQVPTFESYLSNTGFASVAGLPALSMPIGLTASGLPVGLEIVGPAGGDSDVLAIGRLIENLVGSLPAPILLAPDSLYSAGS